ncbi:MAG TPA: hypothetical protein VMS35_02095 [Nitrososphaeraceae archaeon]|nr:hypothetical protein [Nitrososphaeraceae archaeon]
MTTSNNNEDTNSYKVSIEIAEAKSKLQDLSTAAHNANVSLTELVRTIRSLKNELSQK